MALSMRTERWKGGHDHQDRFQRYRSDGGRCPKDHVTPTGLNGARYYDQEFNPESSDIEVFIGIREKEKADIVMAPCECAMTVHHGGYSTLSEGYGAIMNWILENGYEIAGVPFDLYIKTHFDSLSPEDRETEVYFPIRKKK